MQPCDSRLTGIYTAKDSHTRMKLLSERHLGRQAFMTEADIGLRIVVTILQSFQGLDRRHLAVNSSNISYFVSPNNGFLILTDYS